MLNKIRELSRLILTTKLSNIVISQAVGCSHNTVRAYRKKLFESGISWENILIIDDLSLNRKLSPAKLDNRKNFIEPDWADIDTESRIPGVTVIQLHQEYMSAIPPMGFEMMSEREFHRRLKRYRRSIKVTMRQVHRAGEKLFVDYSGRRAFYLGADGKPVWCEIFVAPLGASGKSYVEATHTQQLQDWLMAHVRALEFFGGAPVILVPDCLKSAVTCWKASETTINKGYSELASHYGSTVQPARPGHPQDKGKVENAVKLAQRWILAKIRKRTFYSLAELNTMIWQLLVLFNNRPFKRRPDVTRQRLFETIDQPHLKPLPDYRYVYGAWKSYKVPRDYHVCCDARYYSVPHGLVGKMVNVKTQDDVIKIYYMNQEVATHPRIRVGYGDSTLSGHQPPNHRAMSQDKLEYLLAWAAQMGGPLNEVVMRTLEVSAPKATTERNLMGLKRLAKEYEDQVDRLQAACKRGLAIGAFSNSSLRSILSSKMESAPVFMMTDMSTPAIAHKNVRGAQYFIGG